MEEKEKYVSRRIEEFRNERKIYVDIPAQKLGGQQCGMPHYPTIVEHEGLGIKISINYYRSNHKNREMAVTLFDLAFDEIVK